MDPTFAKEITAANIYRKYLPTPEVNLVRFNVQGDYLGIYAHTESVDKQFLQKHFSEKELSQKDITYLATELNTTIEHISILLEEINESKK